MAVRVGFEPPEGVSPVATRPGLECVDERDDVLIGADGDRLGVVPFQRSVGGGGGGRIFTIESVC
jgi:hypothetical protein